MLSDQLQDCMKGRRLISAVFLTYRFDPGFFEQEVLPAVLDAPLSHATAIRLAQLEELLRDLPGHVAVYFDASGLVTDDTGSAKLDVRRIPIRHGTGIFHPKNVFLLVEEQEPGNDGHRARTLIVATMSANLTRAGWWENVEVCHIEELAEGGKTRLRDDLLAFLHALMRRSGSETEHLALRDMTEMLRGTEGRLHRSADDRLFTHFYGGRESVADFLDHVAGSSLRGAYLEILSPYFDDATDCRPLAQLIERFQPRETRVFLPRSADGRALCRREVYEAVRAIPGVTWGRLPKDLLRLGSSDDAGERMVHAKVYRFFTPSPKREILFVGSVNLTSAAHQVGGNVESGFLVEIDPPRKPEFWQSPDERRPVEFDTRTEDEDSAASGGTPLVVRYHWDSGIAEAFWDAASESPALQLEARGMQLGVSPLAPRAWTALGPELASRLAELLSETSLVRVWDGGEEPATLLVQEEGMSHKPSLLMQLSVADILRYWSLLSPEQRAAFLDARAPEMALLGPGADLVTRARATLERETLFDKFAGVFHAFGCLERAVRQALDKRNDRDATYRLFGKKYDSLGSLIDKVQSDSDGDDVERYVVLLCARQLCREVGRAFPDYWRERRDDVRQLEERFRTASAIRARIVARDPVAMPEFLDWFDRWFLPRASRAGADA